MPDIQKHKCRVVADYIHSWFLFLKDKINEWRTDKCDKCGKQL